MRRICTLFLGSISILAQSGFNMRYGASFCSNYNDFGKMIHTNLMNKLVHFIFVDIICRCRKRQFGYYQKIEVIKH